MPRPGAGGVVSHASLAAVTSDQHHTQLHAAAHAAAAGDPVDVEDLATVLADGLVVASDGAGGLEGVSRAQIATGTYTGDGGASQAITGIPFTPQFVMIEKRETVDGTNTDTWWNTAEIMDDNAAGIAVRQTAGVLRVNIDTIVSYQAVGFTVEGVLNANTVIHNFVCIG